MNLRPLLSIWEKDEQFNRLVNDLKKNTAYRGLTSGLEGSQKSFFYGSLYAFTGKTVFIITSEYDRAERIHEDLLSFLPAEELFLLPSRDFILRGEMLGYSWENWEQRMQALQNLTMQKKSIFIAPVSTLLFRMMPYYEWQKYFLSLKQHQKIDRDRLIDQLAAIGYLRVPLIENKGHFSVRGDIVDVFSPGWDNPVRMDFYDDILETIRVFDPVSQRSSTTLSEVYIFPCGETILSPEIRQKGFAKIEQELQQAFNRLQSSNQEKVAVKLKEKVNQHLHSLDKYLLSETMYGYFPFFYDRGHTWLDYLPSDSFVIVDDYSKTKAAGEEFMNRGKDLQNELFMQGEILSSEIPLTWELDEVITRFKQPCLYTSLFNVSGFKIPQKNTFTFTANALPRYYGQWEMLRKEFTHWKKEGYKIFFLASSLKQGESLLKSLHENDFPVSKAFEEDQLVFEESSPLAMATLGNLNNGFYMPFLKIVVITEQELLPKKKKKRKFSRPKEGKILSNYRELSVGDYVVHAQHGIGKYFGVQTLKVEGIEQDYLHISYAGEDKLFVPVDQIHLIQKYKGGGTKPPKLHRLSSNEWQKTKQKVKSSVQDLARDLLSIYSARQSLEGHSFFTEHPWKEEFDSYFPYEETEDQLQSIKEVRADLAQNKPMDRLLCGDVGYGKTEVAMRAAFDVVVNGKQVAVLAPTTILAQQHYRNFWERFEPFPVEVAMISRFLNNAQQKEILQRVKGGNVDILIGTHRLLSSDVKFKDLGLIIIDEEHRFGVRHKEKLKKMRLNVDVLTLTATPIPRTLHMSLVGARDLSLMETPPENRYPVQTYVLEYSHQVVKEAITRELERNGQVYFVFNRVHNIESWARKLEELLPQARIAVAHGQMNEKKLEGIMHDFLEGYYDVLLSTTIIEAGLDIPNVNTLIIYNADLLGLAQLYQLRGRVGRSNRLAYAYLTFQKQKVLTEAAEKRLQAIKEFAELGSGFKIALRDLEIRGVGNILGPEQHGFMAAVGFDLYCQMLEEAVSAYKGEELTTGSFPSLDLKISAYLPSAYIPDQEQKIEFYQRIYGLETFKEIKEIEKELVDRFGPLPLEVENLLLLGRLRIMAVELGIESIQHENKEVSFRFADKKKLEYLDSNYLTNNKYGQFSVYAGKGGTLNIKPTQNKNEISLQVIEDFLHRLRDKVKDIVI